MLDLFATLVLLSVKKLFYRLGPDFIIINSSVAAAQWQRWLIPVNFLGRKVAHMLILATNDIYSMFYPNWTKDKGVIEPYPNIVTFVFIIAYDSITLDYFCGFGPKN